MKKISVIIVSWNARELLRGCLESIRRSGGPLVREVIVVDNASTDGSPDMVAQDYPEVSLVRSKENLGFARANNLAMKQASGPYWALINSDVVVHAGCFERLVEFLEVHSRVGLVAPKILGADGRLQCTCKRLPSLWNTICGTFGLDTMLPQTPLFSGREMRHWDRSTCEEVEMLSGCFWLARREAVTIVGGLDERFFFYAEDVDWCKRFRDAGWGLVYLPEATATHYDGGSSANAPFRYSIQFLRANLDYWRKYWGIPGYTAFYLLSVIHHSLRSISRGLKLITSNDSVGEVAHRFKLSQACLRWLLTGKGI